MPTVWAKFMKTSAAEYPPPYGSPAGRGNRVGARLGSPREAGGNLQEGACVDSARAIGRSLLNIAPPEDNQSHGDRREDIQRDIRQVQRLHRRV